jgi:hypothetical protein
VFSSCPASAQLGSVRLGSARLCSGLLCSARRKHRFVYCCVIAGTCFDVTVLAWRKYATISSIFLFIRGLFCNAFSTIYLWLYSLFFWTLTDSQFLDLLHSRYDFLDRGSARRKTATSTRQHKHRINAHRRPSFKWDSNPVFKRAKTVHDLDRSATVIGNAFNSSSIKKR